MRSRPPRSGLDDVLAEEMRQERESSLLGPESPEGRELGAVVGANVARIRTRAGISLEEVARRSRIREDLLRTLEAGDAIPGLRAIWRLATALNVPFGVLLENTPYATSLDPSFHVQESGRGPVLVGADGRFRSRAVFREGGEGLPEIYELTLAPGCLERAEAHAPGTTEHILVVRGELILRKGDREARLRPGDAIVFEASRPHSYENPGSEDTVAHLVMSYRPETRR